MPARRRRYRRKPKPEVKKPPANAEIKAAEVRLIGIDGEQLGVVPTIQAKQKAEEAGSDLVVVAQKADPPVVRIMDLGKHLYEQRKKQAKQKLKSKGGETKGIRISYKMAIHDQEVRLRQADKFLTDGNKVKLEMKLRGREKGRTHDAKTKLMEFVKSIPSGAEIEGGITSSPNNISAIITKN